jgi:hypothetical protein
MSPQSMSFAQNAEHRTQSTEHGPLTKAWPNAALIPLQVGCIRSWDKMVKTENTKQYTLENMDEHFLVIIDNMVSCRRVFTRPSLHLESRSGWSAALG